jgi:hypothetical protein
MADVSLEQIAKNLGGELRGNQVLAPGPGHSTEDRSLSIKLNAAGNDIIVHSFAGEDAIACKDYVRKKCGLPAFEPKSKNGKGAWTPIAEYVYRNEAGEPYLRVSKFLDGKGKSQFPQSQWDGKRWQKGKPAGPKIPYRLPELKAAPLTTVIFFCEGEKDVDALAKIDLVATTASEGAAAKWPPELTSHFKDRRVVVLPDADAAGRAHGQKVAKALNAVVAEVRVLDLFPERSDGSDVSDWLKNDCVAVKLTKLAKEAPPWEPQRDDSGRRSSKKREAKVARVARDQGVALLDDVGRFLRRFVAYPSEHTHIAHVLWTAHTHLMDAWDSTPRLAFLSPEPGSGKTRSLEVTELLVPDPVAAVNVTPAYMFRKCGSEDGPPTILFDEIDTVFGAKAREHEELRALLNSGHRRGATAGRCVVRGRMSRLKKSPAMRLSPSPGSAGCQIRSCPGASSSGCGVARPMRRSNRSGAVFMLRRARAYGGAWPDGPSLSSTRQPKRARKCRLASRIAMRTFGRRSLRSPSSPGVIGRSAHGTPPRRWSR